MSIHVALNHVTHYKYDRPINLGPQVVRLRPCPHSRTRVISYSLKVTPEQHFINWQQDPQGNYLARLVFPEKTREFRVEVDLVAEMSVLNPFDFFLEPEAENFPFEYSKELRQELAPYLEKISRNDGKSAGKKGGKAIGKRFDAYLSKVPRKKLRSVLFLVALNAQLQKDISYLIRLEPGVQTPEETLTKQSGSCRDSAWLLVQLLRHLALAACFVSGYLIQLKADQKSLDGPSGTEVDFTDLHAWCEVYLPGAGWVGLDPTSGLFAGEGHIPLACSPEPSSAAPISGVVDECECEFAHSMKVERVWEAPRVTKPYSEEQWADIAALGHKIDDQLNAHDVRLTMGGEPTFVAVDDPDGAEWNTDAMGPTKRVKAVDLYHRLRQKYGAEGLMHFGQGKWYPGEQLPRWSLNAYWRRDGQPMWSNPRLYADESQPSGADAAIAKRFLQGVAARLELDGKHVFDAYEDVFYYLWRERRLPVNVDPFDSRLDDPLERDRLRKVFEHGLPNAVGAVLPIARNPWGHWTTGQWYLRDERCYLIPGDSPMGYRLPLDSQPWVSKAEFPYMHAPDQSQTFAPLAPYVDYRQQTATPLSPRKEDIPARGWSGGPARVERKEVPSNHGSRDGAQNGNRTPTAKESASWVTRTAMCAQAREGTLYIFMPPMTKLDDYLAIVGAIESTAVEPEHQVIMEGNEPPGHPPMGALRDHPPPR